MANPEHLEILKRGVKAWNKWREAHVEIQPDLQDLDLNYANLRHVYLAAAKLHGVILHDADLSGADLSRAHLSGANLNGANLSGANLFHADLLVAELITANLNGADLSGADLTYVDLTGSLLGGTNFSKASTMGTAFNSVDLSTAKGLDTVQHRGPSDISVSTIFFSRGKIPRDFLRGCGVPETFIGQIPALVASAESIQFHSCFISYSSADQEFAERLHADLQSKGVRVWFAPHDMPIGARIRPTIDESIRIYDKLLLVLSEHSVSSQWVEQEVETALRKERQSGGTVLFPVRLDDTVFEVGEGWPALVKDMRHVGDFTRWKDHDSYQKAFDRLLRDLRAGA